MKRLTIEQLQAVQGLAEYPSLIHRSGLEFLNDGTSVIRVVSMPNVSWDKVDAIINSELDFVFPELCYHGPSTTYVDPMNGAECELYFIDYEGETLISLVMQKEEAPFAEGTPDEEKISQPYYRPCEGDLEQVGPCECEGGQL
ncbi:hypothetical protein SBF1_50082 [Candidatus Desulfosporosinus infrequens]|uniref:Uncharacterized protein n=1 Tax=Candidatus Desulfosporosinus infrequens TaxID=2043169 RepID=A0A2U3LH30_9FIRM|nr:hypothetical protein SBF1_50082 [Candidatus Desulfosporosinus infrequens]